MFTVKYSQYNTVPIRWGCAPPLHESFYLRFKNSLNDEIKNVTCDWIYQNGYLILQFWVLNISGTPSLPNEVTLGEVNTHWSFDLLDSSNTVIYSDNLLVYD